MSQHANRDIPYGNRHQFTRSRRHSIGAHPCTPSSAPRQADDAQRVRSTLEQDLQATTSQFHEFKRAAHDRETAMATAMHSMEEVRPRFIRRAGDFPLPARHNLLLPRRW